MRQSRSMNPRGAAGVLALCVLLAGCGDDPFQVVEDLNFAASLDVDLSQMELLPSGVYRLDTTVGMGAQLAVSDNATVDYVGYLSDGSIFSEADGFTFTLGSANLLEGWNLGLEGMMIDGERRIIIPPERGYGGNPPPGSSIPPGAVLIFDVTLTGIS